MKLSKALSLSILVVLMVAVAPSAHAAFPGANGVIVFGRNGDLWTVDPASGDAAQLTTTVRAREGLPDWNATGTQVAYTKCRGSEFGNCEIWVIDADGTDATRLTETKDVQETWPTWSPDGTRIAYTSNASDVFQDIWVMDADGTDQTQLTTTLGFDAFPEWSPDGARIAFTSNREAFDDIWVMDPDGTDPVRLTTGDRKIDERPDWSPDGSTIVFSRKGNIWTVSADGSDLTQITDDAREEFAPAFSPDGTRIVFDRERRNGRFSLFTMATDGSDKERLTSGRFDFAPDWQPLA